VDRVKCLTLLLVREATNLQFFTKIKIAVVQGQNQ